MIIAIANTISNNNVKASPFDPDATAFFSRVTAAGGTLTTTEKDAVDTLVKSMKAIGTWTSMKAIYPMVGASAAACAQNLKSASFTGTFTSGWTFSSTGVTGNGTSAFMDSNLSIATSLSLNNVSLNIYSRSSNVSGGDMGNKDIVFGGFCGMFIETTNFLAYLNDLNNVSVPLTDTSGFYSISRLLSTAVYFYKNGSALGTNPKSSNSAGVNTGTLVVGKANTSYSSKQFAFASIGDGLTDTQATNFYTVVQAFQTTLGRQITPTDVDAQAFFNRVTAAGGTLTATERTAVNDLVISMKATGTWTGMKAIYPMVGGSAAACAQNLKSSSFTGTFSSGWTFSSLGITPNGISAFLNTNFIPSSQSINNNTHMSFYSRSNIQEPKTDMGIFKAADVRWSMEANYYSAGVSYGFASDQYNYSTGRASGANTNSQGFYLGTRTNSTTHKGFKNNTQLGTTNTGASGNITNIDANIYIGGTNAVGQPALYSSKQFAFASIGDGLTDTQASDLYNSVQTFQTTLGRQV
jgi:hypothetical protein